MYREILEKLVEWKETENRKILLLEGSKGVGKSYTLKDFGDGCFIGSVIINLKNQDYIRVFFEEGINKEKLCSILEISGGRRLIPGETLIVIENIDCAGNVEDVLKFLYDNMKEFHMAVTFDKRQDMILDKASGGWRYLYTIHMYPLNFKEFLEILNRKDLREKIENESKGHIGIQDKKKLDEYIRQYLYIGGIPSVVQRYMDTGNIQAVEMEKQKILDSFKKSFMSIPSKPLRDKVIQVWESIPEQLGKENKKFQFGAVKITARSREYSEAVQWLYSHKYISNIHKVKEPLLPMEEHMDSKSYEVFVSDVGILNEMYGISYGEISGSDCLHLIKNGGVIEQYVFQELTSNENIGKLYYWVSDATARVEFLFEDSGSAIPVEINLKENAKAQSIKVYIGRYNPKMYISVTEDSISMGEGVLKLPLYSIWNL